mgnify:CR=1 FL=1
MKHLTSCIAVNEDSVITLTETTDCDDQGYYVSCPSVNRKLIAGIDPNGTWYLWLEGNGDPALLTDDNHLEVLHDLADAPDHNIAEGYQRLADGIDILVATAGAEIVEYWLDWRIQAEFLVNGRTDTDA